MSLSTTITNKSGNKSIDGIPKTTKVCQNCILLPSPTKKLTEYRTFPTRKDPSKDNSKQECTVTKFEMYNYNSKQECKDNSKQECTFLFGKLKRIQA